MRIWIIYAEWADCDWHKDFMSAHATEESAKTEMQKLVEGAKGTLHSSDEYHIEEDVLRD